MMLQPKQPVSAVGKRGVAYVAAYILVATAIAATPFVIADNLKADISEQKNTLSLLKKRAEKTANGLTASSLDKRDVASILIPGETAGIAAAEMQRRIANLADISGLTISRMQSVNITQSGRSVALELELEATGKIEGLQKFIYAVESGKPFIFVKDANISVDEAGVTDASAGAEQTSIRMTLEASGWMGGT
jgi:Type II secretion system (T2SS), protein M subtype b